MSQDLLVLIHYHIHDLDHHQLHLKKAVAVDENPSHAIELQAPHLNFKYSQQRHNGTED